MGLFEGKTPAERNKLIAAGVLGLVSLVALYMAFGRSFFGGSTTTATTKSSPTPKPAAPPVANNNKFKLPTQQEDLSNMVVPVVYRPGSYGAPDPGRNIFAFYEPPPPTPFQPPTPTPPPPPKPASPTPTPVFLLAGASPETTFAGSKGFRMTVSGDRFTPDARIYFNQTEMPTTFLNPQQLATNIPDNLIAQPGPRQIIVQTPDGQSYSFPITMNVMPPPKPNLQYIGMIGRKRYNNDTAYFTDSTRPMPYGARLSDVVGGRFRVIDISATEVVLEDTSLGFKHRVPITPASSGQPGTQPGRDGGFIPYNPNGQPQGQVPGNPPGVQRPQPANRPPVRPGDKKEDVDDNDGPGGP